MRYTREIKLANGKTKWVFIPPKDLVKAKLLKTQTFYDGRTARHEIPKLLDIIDKYRSGEIKEGYVESDTKLKHFVNHHLQSDKVKKWSNASISATRSLLKTLLKEMVEGKPLGDHPVQDITVSMCKTLYNNLLEKRTLKTANQNMYTLSSLLDSAVDIELIPFNPVKSFSKITPEKRTEKTWTPDEVTLFLEEAYSDFKYRNIGLLVHMCYEWAQSIKTIVNLEWDSFDWDKEVVNINTGGKVVHIPLEDPLKSLLKKQKEDWDFQKYVIPLPTPSGNYYLPMSDMTISRYFNTVKDKVELGDKCKLAGLRTTAIKEMVEAGVDSLSIMQVTGHTKVESLTPYVDNTIQGAHRALTQRRTNR